MASHLYIIGNGFDKHHDIPSGYLDYRHWLEENEEWSVIETIDDVFGYTDDDWWSNFEDNLASVDSLKIATEKTFENYPNFGSDEFRDRDWYTAELAVERFINYALLEIKKSFRKWIESLPMGNSIKMIKINKREGIFLTFNYTNTLESLYKIPTSRILHIHGNAFCDDELVVGHGKTFDDIQSLMGERIEEGDYVLQRAKDAAASGVFGIRKPIEKIIERNDSWFQDLRNINYIHIFGHSFSEIDIPYFRKIFSSINKLYTLIEVTAYTDDDKSKINSFMVSENIPPSNYQIVNMPNLQYVEELFLDFSKNGY